MPFGGLLTAGIIAGGAIGGAAIGGKAQKDAAKYAADLQWKQYLQGREDLEPWRAAGGDAIREMSYLRSIGWFDEQFDPTKFAEDPGFQFRLKEGQKALERSASARGQVLSGGTLKSLAQYSQGLASQEYAAAYDRWNSGRLQKWNMLTGLSNQGMGSTAATVNAGTTAASNAGEAIMGAGNASAAQWAATGNAIGNAASSVQQYYMMKDIFAPKPTPNPNPKPQPPSWP